MPRPHVGPPGPRPRARAWVLAAVALGVGLVLPVAPASAHDALIGTDPADGAVLDTPPTEVVLTFSADQMDVGTAVQVVDEQGVDHATGAPVVSGPEVVQAVSGLAAGAYEVRWRAVSGDGHALDGTYAFTVARAAGGTDGVGEDRDDVVGTEGRGTEEVTSAAGPADPASPAARATAGAATTDAGGGVPPAALGLGALLVVAIAGLLVTWARRGQHESA